MSIPDDIIHLILSTDTLLVHVWIQLDKMRQLYWTKYRSQYMKLELNIFRRICSGSREFIRLSSREQNLVHYYADHFGKIVGTRTYDDFYHGKACVCNGTNIIQCQRSILWRSCHALQEELYVY